MAQKWMRAADVIWEELDGGALLVDARNGARWTLNASATALWRVCDGQASLNDLAHALARAAGRSLSETRAEVRAFLDSLAAQNLLTPARVGASGSAGLTLKFSALNARPAIHGLGLGHGPRTRPGPRGNSSPG